MSKFTCNITLITGASSGIGAAFARALAGPGCRLVLVARRSDRLQALASELEQQGAQVDTLPADLASEQGIQAVAQKIASEPHLDLLINNAGFGIHGPFAGEPVEIQATMLRVHDEAPLRLTHTALQGMLARKHGAIINVSSVAGHKVTPAGAVYAATKHAVRALSAGLRRMSALSRICLSCLTSSVLPRRSETPEDLLLNVALK